MEEPIDARRIDLLHRLHEAVRRCARRKQSRPDAIASRSFRASVLLALAEALAAGTSRSSPGTVFVTRRPKFREVHAARYSDRIVHHLVASVLAPELDWRPSPASFACRAGKGTHAAVAHLREHMRRLSRNGEVRVWTLQFDIINSFHSIDRPTLRRMPQAPPRAVEALSPTDRSLPFDVRIAVAALIADNPGRSARRAGPASGFDRVPPHKRLRHQAPDCGLPIGNLMSQWFADAYLDLLDQFVRRTLGFGNYVRYLDDFVLLSTNRVRLEAARNAMVDFLRPRLRLEVHADRPLRTAAAGVDFAGAIISPGHCLPRDPCAVLPVDAGRMNDLRTAWHSGVAYARHGAGLRLVARGWAGQPMLARTLGSARGSERLRPRLRMRSADLQAHQARRIWPDFAAQRHALVAGAAGATVLAEVGNTIRVVCSRDARRLTRHGLATRGWRSDTCAPRGKAGRMVAAALDAGRPVAIAMQTRDVIGGCINRLVRWWIEPRDRAPAWWRQHFCADRDAARAGPPRLPPAQKLLGRRLLSLSTAAPTPIAAWETG